MIVRTLALLSLVAIVGAASAAEARQVGNSIRGKVRNSSGQPMPRIIVELHSGNGLPLNQTVTNNEGDFFFGNLGAQGYLVVVSQPDYNVASERVDFSAKPAGGEGSPGETRMVDLMLVRKSVESAVPMPPKSTFAQNVPKEALDAFERGVRLSKEGKREESFAALQEATKIFPDYFNAHFMLGTELLKAGRLDEAIAELEHARRINPKEGRVYQSFGMVLTQQRKYALAAAVFGEAARLTPTDPQIPLMRATVLIDHASAINPSASKEAAAERSHAFELAEKELARAYDMSEKKLVAVHLQRARLYDKRGEPSRAADELEEYLRKAPDDKKADALRDAIKKLRAGGEKPAKN